MARPRKADLDRRTVQINPRFTALQAAAIEESAASAGISSTEFVYRSAINAEITTSPRRSADPHLITKLDRLGVEVASLGNVVNQVAKYCHVDRDIPHDMPQLAEDIRRLRSQIEKTIDSVVCES